MAACSATEMMDYLKHSENRLLPIKQVESDFQELIKAFFHSVTAKTWHFCHGLMIKSLL